MPTYRLRVEYEGTRYRGWQEQKNARTVAGELRGAIEAVVGGGRVELGGAGRTDAGVHALEQAAHLRLASRPGSPAAWVDEVNERLPADIHVLDAREADDRFHARHHARLRSYLYQVSRRRTALGKRFVWWVRRDLDARAMTEAAAGLVGRHDFAAFCEQPEEQSSTLVVVEQAQVATDGDLVLVRVAASHFLWKMVRRLVGALVAVGAGELPPAELARLLEAPRSAGTARFRPAEHTAPPSGLFLERVVYDGDAPLGALAPAMPVSGGGAPARARASERRPRPAGGRRPRGGRGPKPAQSRSS
jgi:tRNA pseudouridine38-40 synthase